MARWSCSTVRGQWKYLYRTVDKAGNTIDFLLRAQRDKAAARRFFEKAIAQHGQPDTMTIDGSASNLAALHDVNAERETPITIRQVKYAIGSLLVLAPLQRQSQKAP
jgi:transposase-like protein